MRQSDSEQLLCDISQAGIATLTLNRPEVHNAFDSDLIRIISDRLAELADNPDIRCLILRAKGKHFSAGADLNWMRSMALKSQEENLEDARILAGLMSAIDHFPHPVITMVQGAAYGGALGLIACSDIVLATPDARFCLSEVKLGLAPATIAPYVCRAIGVRQARRYMITAEVMDASQALALGLVHIIISDDEHSVRAETLESRLALTTQAIISNSPDAITSVKELCRRCHKEKIDDELISYTSELIAELRASEQGQEGLSAFLQKRRPDWDRT